MPSIGQCILIALLPLLTASRSIAVGQVSDECKYWRASAVFIGKVARTYKGNSKVERYRNGVYQKSNTPVLHIRFVMERTFSGRSMAPIQVECANCLNGSNIRLGQRYLVYAHGGGAKGGPPYEADTPAPVTQVNDEIEYLKQITAPGTIAHAMKRVVTGALIGSHIGDKVIHQPKPAYPALAKASGASGAVFVVIIVDPSGRVIRAEAVCGHPLLRAICEESAKMNRYPPTKINGRAVSAGGLLTYNFALH